MTRLFRLREATPATYRTGSWLFLRLLGVVYATAFASLSVQVQALIGSEGLLPAAQFMAAVRELADDQQLGLARFHALPTLCWLGAGDHFLAALSIAGLAAAALLILGVAPLVLLPFLWVDYLSLVVVAGDFTSFQWDSLLLETGALAIVLAPVRWRDRWRQSGDPPRVARWLVWWLLFRLMFGSGVVKLVSGDPLWRGLAALTVHFETQPIPTPVAWFAHHLPAAVLTASTAAVLAIELIAPWLIFAGRLRLLAAVLLIAMQCAIAVTGNYAFFNVLTIVLCLMLIDDATFERAGAAFQRRRPAAVPPPVRTRRPGRLALAFALVTVPVSLATLAGQIGIGLPGSSAIAPLDRLVAPFRSINQYGLFAVMTPARPEIIVEGSDDGQTWRAYEFKYKAGDVTRRPPWVAPHQPRLDWQMWFAALGRYEEEIWLQNFFQRLLDPSPAVLGLLAHNPFPDAPPRFVRGMLYRYRFADAVTRRRDRVWWVREPLGPYSPVLSRRPS